MKLVGDLKITVDPKTFQPELHVTVAFPMGLVKDKQVQMDPQEFYDKFCELLVPKVKDINDESA